MVERFDAQKLQARLNALELPYVIDYRPTVTSTNDLALSQAHGSAPHRSLFIADEQTRGRGREGRSWLSEPARNLTFSVLLRPGWPTSKLSGFTLSVGLAVRDALSRFTSRAPKLKWPNDVLVDERKLAGILVETQSRGASISALVVGVGVNVNARELPQEISQQGCSLAQLEGKAFAREAVLMGILEQLHRRYQQFAESGLNCMLAELAAHDALLGRTVDVTGTVGTALGIGPQGELLLTSADGSVKSVFSGSVRIADPS